MAGKHDGQARHAYHQIFSRLAMCWTISAASATGRTDDQWNLRIFEHARKLDGMIVELIHRQSGKVGEHDLDNRSKTRECQANAGTNNARFNLIVLKPRKERALDADGVVRELRPKLSRIPGANIFLTNPPSVRLGGRMARSNYQYTLSSTDLDLLQKWAPLVAKRMETGMVFINHPTWTKPDLPFGGIKISGYGHELSSLGIQEFVNKKLINVVPIDAP